MHLQIGFYVHLLYPSLSVTFSLISPSYILHLTLSQPPSILSSSSLLTSVSVSVSVSLSLLLPLFLYLYLPLSFTSLLNLISSHPLSLLFNTTQHNTSDELLLQHEHTQEIMSKNKVYKSFIGLGYYETLTPGVIQRNVSNIFFTLLSIL